MGRVLKGGEGLVLPEALEQVLGALRTEFVAGQAANESRMDASGGGC